GGPEVVRKTIRQVDFESSQAEDHQCHNHTGGAPGMAGCREERREEKAHCSVSRGSRPPVGAAEPANRRERCGGQRARRCAEADHGGGGGRGGGGGSPGFLSFPPIFTLLSGAVE